MKKSNWQVKGEKHWAYGRTKDNDSWCRSNSLRMKSDNPILNPLVAKKRAESICETFRKNPWPQEVTFMKVLKAHNLMHEFQYPIGPYVIDFFIEDKKLCIEIDSIKKWGKERRLAAAKKDSWLNKQGFKILRIDKRFVGNKLLMAETLKKCGLIS